MDGDAPITEDEVRDLALGFFHALRAQSEWTAAVLFAGGAPLETWFCGALPLADLLSFHAAFAEERHTILELSLQPAAGGRVRAVGEVEWEAVVRDSGAIVQAVLEEDWLIERAEDGGVRFAAYRSAEIRYLPGSAMLEF